VHCSPLLTNGCKGIIPRQITQRFDFIFFESIPYIYSNENDDQKLKFLDELNNFVMSIQKKYENA